MEDPDQRDKTPTAETRKIVTDFVRGTFPGIDSEPSIEESCMYTVRKKPSVRLYS